MRPASGCCCRVHNVSGRQVQVRADNAYAPHDHHNLNLGPGAEALDAWPIAAAGHWYDISVAVAAEPAYGRRLAGHIETGRPSRSDPALDWS